MGEYTEVRNPRKAQFNAVMRSSEEMTYFIISQAFQLWNCKLSRIIIAKNVRL